MMMATKMKVTMTMDRSEIYCRFVLEYPKEVEEARAAEEACIQQLSLYLSLILYVDHCILYPTTITFDLVFISVFDSVC